MDDHSYLPSSGLNSHGLGVDSTRLLCRWGCFVSLQVGRRRARKKAGCLLSAQAVLLSDFKKAPRDGNRDAASIDSGCGVGNFPVHAKSSTKCTGRADKLAASPFPSHNPGSPSTAEGFPCEVAAALEPILWHTRPF